MVNNSKLSALCKIQFKFLLKALPRSSAIRSDIVRLPVIASATSKLNLLTCANSWKQSLYTDGGDGAKNSEIVSPSRRIS